ncbi:MAG: HAD hydrolase-like protein [Lewinellaceae bacterium]|nr:HAD hydrolase-like protein [Lewinellaceae bacterium]HQU53006.1 HAD hydrolase-like protein [Saprospiraceae bacterium]
MELIRDRIRLVVMDMAGTTVRDLHEVEACFAQAAHQSGLQMTDDEIRSVQGWSKRYVFETFWARQLGSRNEAWFTQVAASYDLFKELLEHHYMTQPVFPTEGCLETLQYLQDHQIAVGLTTGFYRQVTDIILKRLGWFQKLDEEHLGPPGYWIQSSLASDEVDAGRPAPDMIFQTMQRLHIKDPGQVVNIGDTPSDIESGRRARVFLNLAVTNGTHTAQQLEAHEADRLLARLDDLIPLLNTPVA